MRTTASKHRPQRPGTAELRDMLEASGDVYIGAAAARDRSRRILIAGLGGLLLLLAAWLYFSLQPRSSDPHGAFPIRVHCTQCGHEEQRRVVPSVAFPLRCSKCDKLSARPLWKCRRCEREFDTVEPGRYLFCPQCRSMSVGTAAEDPNAHSQPSAASRASP